MMRGRLAKPHYAIIRGTFSLLIHDVGPRADAMLRTDAERRKRLLAALDSEHAWTAGDLRRMATRYHESDEMLLADLRSLKALGYVEETTIGRWILAKRYCLRYPE